MNTTVLAWSSSKEAGRDNPLCLSPSEPQRGRKRVRSHLPVMRPLHHEPSCESTLRGRRRNRSNSPIGTVSPRNTSIAARDRRQSPLKQRHVSIIQQQHNTRRSQCPSRSRSANAPPGSTGAQRRRQRTRSRSRVHRLEGMFSTLEMNSPLQFEVLINEPSLGSVAVESGGRPEDR
ncbi:hypothetical protein PoMZ_02176 [Pyricularia oryzae]|uniref:Uncharacterized protein n=1 Tax=Pyricularia oryzae TaxID=318829 RepID=A0A4P7N6M2_PYROR|nr:hypothetical protein PoMZ_02176 [Pyricularia oryzae]